MSSLRAFRFQKVKSPSSSLASSPTSSKREKEDDSLDHLSAQESSDDGPDSPIYRETKRPRLLSSDDSLSPIKNVPSQTFSNLCNGYGFAGMPSPDVVQMRLDLLQKTFHNMDRLDLQDALRSSEWSVEKAIEKLRSDTIPVKKNPEKKVVALSEKKRITALDERNIEMSDSEEEEYNTNGIVYDSDETDEDSDDGDGSNLSDDRRKVLDFFNQATFQELSCIQGCSKKKAENIAKLRPFSGWVDLVSKIQRDRQLSPEMLNSATLLLRMRDAIARLMEKCEKITRKMETCVEDLMNGKTSELTEQPKSIPSRLKMTGYQIIGLNWLVLMHKQSLNGILADEMGLGKTIQAISFLAHLKEEGDEGPYLIIVPSSTMDNWQKEFETWCPTMKVLNYYGSQDERRHMRLQIVQDQIEYDVILTTYNMVISSPEDRILFKKLDFHYVIFDEAHMLKNMSTSRYENLMKVQASRKLLLTGTPMQNNLVELMSLLVFVMPEMFANKKEQLKKMFSMFPRSQGDENDRSNYEKDRIEHAKRIMKPFFLRRLKCDVLTDLPQKSEEVIKIKMVEIQDKAYRKIVSEYKHRAKEIASGVLKKTHNLDSGVGMLMNLRKIANHPLLVRRHFDNEQIKALARILKKDSSHRDATEKFIVEDLSVMSDFDIHKTCLAYRCIEHYSLGNHQICESGKFAILDQLLPKMKGNGDRVLIFSQFTMVLDIMEQYLRVRGHSYLRLDGSTPVQERQYLIDQFNNEDEIFIFILSTKAGGLGINLTAANTVILHDLDFNPYNDKQAEDRCHRVGQTRPVRVIRLISEETIEEGIYSIAQEKLRLEQNLTAVGDDDDGHQKSSTKKDVSRLLKIALDVELSDKLLGDVEKVFTEL